jgi:hypothetical protein
VRSHWRFIRRAGEHPVERVIFLIAQLDAG